MSPFRGFIIGKTKLVSLIVPWVRNNNSFDMATRTRKSTSMRYLQCEIGKV